MRYLPILLLLAGCASPTDKSELTADELAQRNVEIRDRCDFMVGQPRNSEDFIACIKYMEEQM